MGNRFGRQNQNYHLINEEKKIDKKYKIFYISGGQKSAIPENMRSFIKGANVNKNGFVDNYINKFVVCKNYDVLHSKFLNKIKPIFYNIYELHDESWIGKTNKEMLVRPKSVNPVNTHIIDKYYSNILVEDMGWIENLDTVKKRPNIKIIL